MPSVINSDDGVVSGTAGLKTSGSNDGITVFQQNGTESARITAAGNVGIGTNSPNIGGANTDNAILTLKGKASPRGGIFEMGNFGTTGNDQTLGWNRYFDGSTENASIEVARASSTSTAYMKFSTNGGSGNTERARIDSSGNLLVGKTTTSTNSGPGVILYGQSTISGYGRIDFVKTSSGTFTASEFNHSTGAVGTITYSNTATAYNTSSDYRLKENIQSMTGALARVQALKPVTYNWKINGSAGEGFIAHELAEVVPQCVTGEKDAIETYIDEEGNEQTRPVYQGIDTSFLVATLTAAIQELKAELDATKAEVAALKAAAAK